MNLTLAAARANRLRLYFKLGGPAGDTEQDPH